MPPVVLAMAPFDRLAAFPTGMANLSVAMLIERGRRAVGAIKLGGAALAAGAGQAAAPTDLEPSFHFWRGASGRLYRHSTHTTVFCPLPQHGVYVLARRDADGRVKPLFVGLAASRAASLDLARIRHRAVGMGATEVHLCPVNPAQRGLGLRRIARDLRRGIA